MSALFGTPSIRLLHSSSCEVPKSGFLTIRRASTACLDSFSDKEFSKKIQELALRFQLSDSDVDDESADVLGSLSELDSERNSFSHEASLMSSSVNFEDNRNMFPMEPPWSGITQEPPNWTMTDEIIPASIEQKANSIDLPHSLRDGDVLGVLDQFLGNQSHQFPLFAGVIDSARIVVQILQGLFKITKFLDIFFDRWGSTVSFGHT